MSSGRYSVSVILTSVNDPIEQRHLTITHKEPTRIGRASRSAARNLRPLLTNALFDCPVVSRSHAELNANPWAPPAEQITITDKGSMHGTRVNGRKIEKNKPMALRSGDTLQFGTSVTRGPDTHDGVMVTFDCVPRALIESSQTLAGSYPVTNKGYKVPDDSDVDSVDGDASDFSDDEPYNPVSSAKTTPEQAKLKLGSQEQPIDLDDMPPPPPPRRAPIIDLDDEDDMEIVFPSTQARSKSDRPKYVRGEKTVIEDSVDKYAEILVSESVGSFRSVSQIVRESDHISDDDIDAEDEDDGHPEMLDDRVSIASDLDDEGENPSELEDELEYLVEDEAEEDEDEDEEFEVGAEAEEDEDEDHDHIDGSMHESDNEDVPFEDDELHSYSSKKHASPELEPSLPFPLAPSSAPAPKEAESTHLTYDDPGYPKFPARGSSLSQAFKQSDRGSLTSHPGPRNFIYRPQMNNSVYDPVRGSQRDNLPDPFYLGQVNFAPPESSAIINTPSNPRDGSSGYGRYSYSDISAGAGGNSADRLSTSEVQHRLHTIDMEHFGFHHSWDGVPDVSLSGVMAPYLSTAPPAHSALSPASPIASKNRMAISELLGGATPSDQAVQAPDLEKKAESDPVEIGSDSLKASLKGKKRKAEEMTDEGTTHDSEEVKLDTAHAQTPPAKQIKVEATTSPSRSVAREVGKFAAYAAVGAVGMFTLLSHQF